MGYSRNVGQTYPASVAAGQVRPVNRDRLHLKSTGAVMILRVSSRGFLNSKNLLGHLLHRITTLILITITIGLSIESEKIGICEEKRSVPNIVLILADDLGWADVGCNGSQYYEMPQIDRLARQ